MKNFQNGYKGIDVEIISMTKHPAKIIWDMLKQTWISLHNVEYDVNNPTIKSFIDDSLAKRLNPVPQEVIEIQVIFKNISRINLAQVTRQRGWFFNSESQMPQHVKHNVMIPLNIVNSKYYERVKKLVEDSQKLYDEMVEDNIPFQDARYILIHGQTADIAANFNLPQLIGAAGQRLENNTHDEINYMFRILINKLKIAVKEDKEMDELDKHIYEYLLSKCDCFGADRKVCTCYDAMFGNSFKRFPDANDYVTKATEECLFDYTKLAWYQELKRIYKEEPELLLSGEKEMIESWEE